MDRRVFAASLIILLGVAPAVSTQGPVTPSYQVEDLGTTSDGFVPTVTGMNASGQVSGYVSLDDGSLRAVRYADGSGWTYLVGLESVYSAATAINSLGDLTGYYISSTGLRAFRYADGAGFSPIPAVPDSSMGIGFAIADNGDVVGYDRLGAVTRAWRASPGLSPTVPAALAALSSRGCGVNAAGQMVGSFTTAEGFQRAFRLETNGSLTEIGSLDGNSSAACAIDSDGLVGGQSTLGDAAHAFLAAAGTPSDIDTLGSSMSRVGAISQGVSVGLFFLPSGLPHAFVHTAADGMKDLNNLVSAGSGWELQDAVAIDAAGRIAGQGVFAGNIRAFRLTPATAADTTAPVISSVTADPSTIWPPKGQTVSVTTSVTATDNSGAAPTCTLSSITVSGAASPDASVTGANTGTVKAVGGRTYAFNETCTDGSGNSASASVNVTVPPDVTAPVIAALTATPSSITPPNGAMVPVTVSVSATDDVDDAPVCALSTVTGGPAVDSSVTGPITASVKAVGNRIYSLLVSCADAAGNASTRSVNVVVPPDTTAPVIASLTASPDSIWPPNNKLVAVALSVSATDDVDAAPQCSLTAITSNGGGSNDAAITGQLTANVRAEKNGDGSTRVYYLHVTCGDQAGNTSVAKTSVAVEKDSASAKHAALRALLARLTERLLDAKEHRRARSGRD